MDKYDIVQVKKIEGRDKPLYIKHGILLIKDDGKISIMLNSVPAGEWNGWLNAFEQKPREHTDVYPVISESDF